MTRIVTAGALALALSAAPAGQAPPSTRQATPFSVVEATIPQMQEAMRAGRVTSRQLVEQYLQRIGLYDGLLHAAVYVNPNALKEADAADAERRVGKVRGPLHGIPIALKDNIHTTHIPTSGGALAFEHYIPPYEATLTRHLREAGAIIIAKATLSELANFVAGAPTPMPGNYNAVSGQGYNPYDPRKDPRDATFDGRPAMTAAGSSSGIGTAANLWAANIGTETSGSILGPSNVNMLAAVKPTVGRISRWGVIPITADQDSAGPMTRTVTDAAILLGAMEGASPDPNDPATSRCAPPPNRDYTPFLKPDALKGARIGIPRAFYYDRITMADGSDRGGLNEAQRAAMNEAVAILKAQGAIIVDPADVPSALEKDPVKNIGTWNFCAGAPEGKAFPDARAKCTTTVIYGMKRDFNRWLATLGPGAPVKTLTELREWNTTHQKAGAIRYGQARLDISDEIDLEADRARYDADHTKDVAMGGVDGIDAAIKAHNLDALLFPGSSSAGIAARPGYPTVLVPFAKVPNDADPPFPPGFNARPVPYGVGFTAGACSEPKLLGLAYAFEQATRRRVPPEATP